MQCTRRGRLAFATGAARGLLRRAGRMPPQLSALHPIAKQRRIIAGHRGIATLGAESEVRA